MKTLLTSVFSLSTTTLSRAVRRTTLGALLLGGAFVASPSLGQQLPAAAQTVTNASGESGRPAATMPVVQPVAVERVGDLLYRVRVSNPTQQAGSLQLISATDGKVLYTKTSSKHTFGQMIDVQALPDGHYTFVVKLGNDTHRYTLSLRTQRATELTPVSTGNISVARR